MWLGDDGNRRKSVEPGLSARPRFNESDSTARSVQAGPGAADKQRTDSVVAQLGPDSTDASDNTACRECGSHSFKTKMAKDRTARVRAVRRQGRGLGGCLIMEDS